VTTVTDAEGHFELKELIAGTPYTMQQSTTRTASPGGGGPSRSAFTQLSTSGFQTSREGVQELGDIKARVYSPPTPRPRIPNDPNIQ
jgi:hypothetical protein